MFRPSVNVSTTDNMKEMERALRELSNMDVLVGVPEDDSNRPNDDGINNAELAYIHTHGVRSTSMRQEMDASMATGASYNKAHEMYIHEHGSPAWHVPPRPIIEPAIEDPDNKKFITEDLGEAAKAVLNGDSAKAKQGLQKAGMDAQNIVRDWFTNPRNNWAPNAPSTIKAKGSERPLIDTAELRKSIHYVIHKKDDANA